MSHSVQLTHNCIICGKQNLLKLSEHLRQVHQLSCEDRQPWLRAAVFSNTKTYPLCGTSQQSLGINPLLPQYSVHQTLTQTQTQKPRKPPTKVPNRCLDTKPYPDFQFNHMFSMLVVSPSQCGKTYFVEKVLTESSIQFPENKPQQIVWFYNQWQK